MIASYVYMDPKMRAITIVLIFANAFDTEIAIFAKLKDSTCM